MEYTERIPGMPDALPPAPPARTLERLLRATERYTKTDMVYLFQVGLWSNLSFVITSGLALLLSIAFANLLPPAVYGVYQYLISLSALMSAVLLSGMDSAVSQAVARGYEGALRNAVKAKLRYAILPIVASLAAASYYALHGNYAVATGLVVISVFSPLISTFSLYSSFLTGKKAFRQNFWYGLITTAAYYGSIFLALVFLKNAPFLLFVNLGANAIAIGFAYWHTVQHQHPNDRDDGATVPYGTHLSVMSAFGLVLTQIDSLLVFHFLGPVKLAVYSFASMIPERAGSMFSFVGAAALPKFATQPRADIRKGIVAKALRLALVAAVGALVYALAAPLLFRLVFPQYLAAIPYTQAYAAIIALIAVLNFLNAVLIAQQMKRALYIVSFLNPLLLIFLQLPLLFSYGVLGMLVARMLADGIAIAVTLLLILYSTETPADERPEKASREGA